MGILSSAKTFAYRLALMLADNARCSKSRALHAIILQQTRKRLQGSNQSYSPSLDPINTYEIRCVTASLCGMAGVRPVLHVPSPNEWDVDLHNSSHPIVSCIGATQRWILAVAGSEVKESI
jgi:hypothetical protein